MNLKKQYLFLILPLALIFGAGFASLQPGNWLIGFAAFSFLFFLSLAIVEFSYRWASQAPEKYENNSERDILRLPVSQQLLTPSLRMGKTLARILAIAFALRLLAGVSLYIFLPIHGHEDADDKAGYVFTDAHRRDDQAWGLASSDRPILDAFSEKFAYDQYGGLLAFSALVYRYLSPDAHRPLMLVLMSAVVAALGIPFLWKATNQILGEKVAFVAAWIFALYPESILLGSSAMREPYLLTFSALALWGFVEWRGAGLNASEKNARTTRPVFANLWLALGLVGMLLVSPSITVATVITFAGWVFFTDQRRNLSWKVVLAFAVVFMIGTLFLSTSLNRSGEFDSSSPLRVVNDWLRLAVKWNAYQIERESGWVQKLFDEMPKWMRLPFVAVYGILQPVLPAALVAPTEPIWKAIFLLRALGWYVLLPMLILCFRAGAGFSLEKKRSERSVILWLSLLAWTWILLAALRGGGDQWDNPRYRTIMLAWQAILAGYVWVWWSETRNMWLTRVAIMEAAFLLVFTQWYASRYFYLGGQLPFAWMVVLILGLWGMILGYGLLRDRKRTRR
jgi:hypothetical protein